MSENPKNSQNKLALKIAVGIAAVCVAAFMAVMFLTKSERSHLVYPAPYTYRCEADQNIQTKDDREVGKYWLNSFLAVYTKASMPKEAGLSSIKTAEPVYTDEANGIVELKFTGKLRDNSTNFFDEWGGNISGGNIECTWDVSFGIEEEEGKNYIYLTSFKVIAIDAREGSSSDNDTAGYNITDSGLSVTFDGGYTYIPVPVETEKLPLTGKNNDKCLPGSFDIYNGGAAFLYGGKIVNGENIPLSVIYSNDGGNNWSIGEIDSLYNVSYYYINMMSSGRGVIVAGFNRTEDVENSRIYTTADSARSWKQAGAGPVDKPLVGVKYINVNTGFFCYDDEAGGNLYYTRDGGLTFSQCQFPAQELDTDSGAGAWDDIFKVAQLPVENSDGTLTVILKQPKSGTYKGGKVAAEYKSSDGGVKWTFIREREV